MMLPSLEDLHGHEFLASLVNQGHSCGTAPELLNESVTGLPRYWDFLFEYFSSSYLLPIANFQMLT